VAKLLQIAMWSVSECFQNVICKYTTPKKFTKNMKGSPKKTNLRSMSLKVINVDKSKKPVTSACYDKQHVCTYLQPFSHYTSQ